MDRRQVLLPSRCPLFAVEEAFIQDLSPILKMAMLRSIGALWSQWVGEKWHNTAARPRDTQSWNAQPWDTRPWDTWSYDTQPLRCGFLVKIWESQLCLEPIKNCGSARSAHQEARYLEVLLYTASLSMMPKLPYTKQYTKLLFNFRSFGPKVALHKHQISPS